MSDEPPIKAEADVISFEKAALELRTKGEPIFTIKRGDACWHLSVVVDEYRRTVECAKCEAKLSPFDVLMKFAREEVNLVYRLQSLKDDIEKKADSLEDLKRQERNARSRLKRLQEKIDSIEDEFRQ